MFRLVFLTLTGFCVAQKFDYRAEQENITLKSLPDNPYIELLTNGSDEYPKGIKYLQNIEMTTPLMIRVIFGDENGPLDPENAENTKLTICQILDKELDDPLSAQKRYSMASSMGLGGKRCPIEKGIKWIEPYNFPTRFATKDLGSGDRYYAMRIEDVNQSLADEPIMELRVHIKLDKDDGTGMENSCSILSFSSLIGCLVAAWLFFKFTK